MDVLERIKELCLSNGWTIYKLAEEAELTGSTLSNMFSRKTLPSLNTLMAICKAFNITPSQFFDKDGVMMTLSEEEQFFIQTLRGLNKSDKALVQTIMNELATRI